MWTHQHISIHWILHDLCIIGCKFQLSHLLASIGVQHVIHFLTYHSFERSISMNIRGHQICFGIPVMAPNFTAGIYSSFVKLFSLAIFWMTTKIHLILYCHMYVFFSNSVHELESFSSCEMHFSSTFLMYEMKMMLCMLWYGTVLYSFFKVRFHHCNCR